jgi:hypothetical protein
MRRRSGARITVGERPIDVPATGASSTGCSTPGERDVPAHDEHDVIGRLLTGLCRGDDRLDVVVVCNGCTDGTAAVARTFPGVRVIETPVASKRVALRLGNEAARDFPRVYVDADVEIGAGGRSWRPRSPSS